MADLKEKRKTKKDLKSKIKTKTSAYQTGQLEKKKKKKKLTKWTKPKTCILALFKRIVATS